MNVRSNSVYRHELNQTVLVFLNRSSNKILIVERNKISKNLQLVFVFVVQCYRIASHTARSRHRIKTFFYRTCCFLQYCRRLVRVITGHVGNRSSKDISGHPNRPNWLSIRLNICEIIFFPAVTMDSRIKNEKKIQTIKRKRRTWLKRMRNKFNF